MQLSNTPGKFVLPFAADGGKNSIPVASQIGITGGAASLTDGFPPLTRTPIAAGGIPPSGLDMNGILFEMSDVIRWANAGGGYAYDGTFATDTNVGGYPKGARVLRADGLGYWFNTVENNVTNPDDSATAAGWVPDFTSGTSAITMTNANVTLTPVQYGKPIIVITGLLTADLNLIFPTIVNKWIVLNNTTGSHSITCKTASGTGVVVYQGGATCVFGDGVNIIQYATSLPQLASSIGATLIGWVRSASNAVVTTISNWLNWQQANVFEFMTPAQIADVQAYGYTLDVTAAIVAALAKAAGGTVICPAGGYLFNSAAIELSDSTNTNIFRPAPKFRGDGMAKTIFLNRFAGFLFTHTQTAAQATAGSFARGFKFSGIDLIGDGSSPTGAAGFSLLGAYFPVFEDGRIYGLKGSAIVTPNSTISASPDGFSCGTVTANRMVITANLGWAYLSTAFGTDYNIQDCYTTANYGGHCLVGSAHRIKGGSSAGNGITGNTGATKSVSSITWAAKLVTVTTSTNHGYATGDAVLINGNTTTGWVGAHIITVTGPTTFTYPLYTDPGSTGGTTTAMQLSGGTIFAYQGGNQNMNCIMDGVEIQVNNPTQVWIQGQNCEVKTCRILDDDQGTATFHSPVQVDIGGVFGSLSDDNKVRDCLFRLTSASGTPAVTLMRNNLSSTAGGMTARRNRLINPHLAPTGAPVVTNVNLVNPTSQWAFGSGQSMFPEVKAVAKLSVNTSIGATPNSIMIFDTVVYDSYSAYNVSAGGSFTAPYSGLLEVQIHSNISSAVTGKTYQMSLLKNGTSVQDWIFEFTTPTGVSHRDLLSANCNVPCSINDVFQIALWAVDVGGAGAVYTSATESCVTYKMSN